MCCTSCANEVPSPGAGELYPGAVDHRDALKHLDNTNEPATAADISLVSNIVLPAIQNQHDKLLACITRLQDVCSALNAEAVRYKNMITPCRRLPAEILSEVFQHACIFGPFDGMVASRNHSGKGVFDPQAAQWTIARVCASWRTVILNCQAIWSIIPIVEPRSTRCFGPKHVDALNLILSRCGNHPLHVALEERHYGAWGGPRTNQVLGTDPVTDASSYRHCRTIYETIFAESHRWRTAVFFFSGNRTRNAFISLHGKLPNLTSLVLRVTESSVNTPIVITGFSDCPRLHTVELQFLVEVDVQWSQILHVVVRGNRLHENMRHVLQFINRCKAARSLRLDRPGFFGEFEDLTLIHTITNPSIRTLSASHTQFIDHLVLPELREVICTDPHSETESGFLDINPLLHSLTRLLERSKCALHLTCLRLRMDAGPGEQDMITTLLYTTPNLTTLDLELRSLGWRDEIEDYCYNNVADRSIMILLDKMHPARKEYIGPQGPLLPVVNSVSIVLHGHDDEGCFQSLDRHDALVDMLRLRWKPEEDPVLGVGLGRLKKFKLWVHAVYLDDAEFDRRGVGFSKGHRLPEAVKQALRDLVDDGMDLSIRVTTRRIEKGQDYVRLAIG